MEQSHALAITVIISDKSLLTRTDTWGKQVYSIFIIAAGIPSMASILSKVKRVEFTTIAPILLIMVLTAFFLIMVLVYHEVKQARAL
ncbi:hypothetical protein TRIP_C20019 [Candidatus Zixiibacteriota bacterium]|nr:hypothetical protein TRIP_C20019 [candidate division Zixibacteria bacterium]